jgi:hypothetical protein
MAMKANLSSPLARSALSWLKEQRAMRFAWKYLKIGVTALCVLASGLLSMSSGMTLILATDEGLLGFSQKWSGHSPTDALATLHGWRFALLLTLGIGIAIYFACADLLGTLFYSSE